MYASHEPAAMLGTKNTVVRKTSTPFAFLELNFYSGELIGNKGTSKIGHELVIVKPGWRVHRVVFTILSTVANACNFP